MRSMRRFEAYIWPFWAFIWPLIFTVTLVDCCQIENLDYNSLTSTSVVLTWEVVLPVSYVCK